MAQVLNVYTQILNTLTSKEIDLANDNLKLMLVSSAYTPNKATDKYKNSITNEITGVGYTAGGTSLTSVTYTIENNIATLKSNNVMWTNLNTNNLRYAVLYDNTPVTDDKKPLIAYIDFGETISIINTELEIAWNANGIIRISIV